MTDTTKLLRQYESLLEAAEDDEQIFRAKLADATRRRAHWQRRIAELKADDCQSASLVAAE
ncbi:hypothetical protein HJB79_32075 [Rhizobium lentis]|uniref:hypothetical protein n=1 Tax=Rhizobium lentis TaxID=1138194 RepID=UPI001C82FBF5|nr:hypothetical protein [Rhizobium lentis]MBX5143337.1 hypothetical protein [Rhizobium lentis]